MAGSPVQPALYSSTQDGRDEEHILPQGIEPAIVTENMIYAIPTMCQSLL